MKKYLPIFSGTVAFCVAVYLLARILPGVQSVEIDLEIDHPDQLSVFYSQSPIYSELAVSKPMLLEPGRGKIKVLMQGAFGNFLRFDIGEKKGITRIYEIKVTSWFHAPRILQPAEIKKMFIAGPHVTLRNDSDYLEVVAQSVDPHIDGISRIFPHLYWQSCLLAALFAMVSGLISMSFLQDVSTTAGDGPKASVFAQQRIQALDGLRGLAAIMVVADHTWPWFKGLGASGVWIFFAISGFLLARPFVFTPERIFSPRFLANYLRRRFLRIVPMYYVYLFIVFILTGRTTTAIMHGLFIEGTSHLWAIPQEIIFYLLWPLVIGFFVVPLRHIRYVVPLVLLLLIFLWNRLVTHDHIWLLGMDYIKLPLYFGVFLTGAIFSFTYSLLSAGTTGLYKSIQRICKVVSPFGFILILVFLLLSNGYPLGNKIMLSQRYYEVYSFIAGLLIFLTLYSEGGVLDRFLRLAPLQALGKVGLSLYLLHPLVKILLDDAIVTVLGFKIQNGISFGLTIGCTYLLARYTYKHIELPGMMQKRV
jgi:peptidoglycan/LPS O-acetylase OafA/YrhL